MQWSLQGKDVGLIPRPRDGTVRSALTYPATHVRNMLAAPTARAGNAKCNVTVRSLSEGELKLIVSVMRSLVLLFTREMLRASLG